MLWGGDEAPSAEYILEFYEFTNWGDEQAFDTFIASETFKKVTSWGLKNVLAGRPSHTTYRTD